MISRWIRRVFGSELPDHEWALRQLVIDSGFFDEAYYLERYPDVSAAGVDPALHFVRHGGLEGRNPGRSFDSQFYLTRHPDVAHCDLNPLVHYIQFGREEGREIRALSPKAPKPKAPTAKQWHALAAEGLTVGAGETTELDVIIPIYRGFDETANCIHSVIQSKREHRLNFEVVAVDDAGPDAELRSLLGELKRLRLITLIRNEKNLGFVHSVNRGMQLHEDRDVILLNSDTEVYGDWAARLRRVAYSTKEIGTVTPLSNNATICSYPKFPDEFDGPFEVGFEGLDELARQANANASVDVPTGVGFCMFIRRVCIDQVGYFDVDTFKTGYGEENDFCLRIAARGWRSVLAGNVFVRHLGRISFREMAQERLKDALHEIDARYPTYRQNIEAFIATDPPRSLRHSLDIARLKRAAGARVFVFVLHGEGGGTLKHAEDLADDLRQTGVGVLFLRPVISNGSIAELSHPDVHDLSGAHLIDLRHGLPHGIRVFRELGVEHIHIHHLLGYSPEIIDFIPKLAEACGIRYDFTFHDYLAACPRIDMIDGSGFYCDNFDVNRCETCISKFGSLFGDVAVWEWRERYGRMLRGARRLFVPNLDAQHRLKALFPGLDTIVRAHHESAVTYIGMPQSQQKAQQSKAKAELDVAIVGGLSLRKGARVLLEMANDASQRRLPIKFVLFGYSDLPEFKTMPNVKVLGKYSEGELPKLLHASGCRVVFFPAIWPETYSYTLSEAYRANCFPVAFDIGAIADRIRASGWGRVLPFRLAREPRGVNDLLLALKIDRKPDHFFIPVGSYDPERMLEEYYGFMAPRRHLSCGSRDQFDHL